MGTIDVLRAPLTGEQARAALDADGRLTAVVPFALGELIGFDLPGIEELTRDRVVGPGGSRAGAYDDLSFRVVGHFPGTLEADNPTAGHVLVEVSGSFDTGETIDEAVTRLVVEFDGKAPDDALDDLVHDAAQEETLDDLNGTDDDDEQEDIIGGSESRASDINNGGLEAQLRYLLAGGTDEATIREALEG